MACFCAAATVGPDLTRIHHDDEEWDNAIVTLFLENIDAVRQNKPKEGLIKFKARQTLAFTCKGAEKFVIKYFSPQKPVQIPPAQSQQNRLIKYVHSVHQGRQLIKKNELDQIKIPDARAIFLKEHGTLIVMDRVQAELDADKARNQFEKEFDQFSKNPRLEVEWKEKIRQAATFICLSGYWDVSHKNVLLDEKTHQLSFVDFEDVDPSEGQITLGLLGLLKMAPPSCFDIIFDVAEKHAVDVTNLKLKALFDGVTKKQKEQDLAFNARLREFRNERPSPQKNERPSPQKIDIASLSDPVQKTIAEQLNLKIDFDKSINILSRKEPYVIQRGEIPQEAFETAIDNLQKNGLLIWKPANTKEAACFVYC